MRLSTRWRIGLSAIMPALLLALPPSPAFASDVRGTEPTSSVRGDPTEFGAEIAGRRVAELARVRSALGVYWDKSRSEFVVVIPASGPGSRLSEADFSSLNVRVLLHSRNITQAAIDLIKQRISQRSWHLEAKKYAYGFFYDIVRGVVHLGTDAPPAVVAPLIQEFPNLIDYQQGVTGLQTRQADSPPFWGGAVIRDGPNLKRCTSGFVVQDPSATRFMMTAAHCFSLNTSVFNGTGTNTVGQVTRRGPYPTWDVELISGGSYGSFIYRGSTTGSSSHVAGAGAGIVGIQGYCVSGAAGGEHCNQTLNSDSGSFCGTDGYCHYSLYAYSGGGRTVTGDSGAPFYFPDCCSSESWIRGLHIGIDPNYMYAEEWPGISAAFGVSIVT